MENYNIDDEIKSYEPLMHRVLINYKVKEDYEDLLQEMRIVVWKAHPASPAPCDWTCSPCSFRSTVLLHPPMSTATPKEDREALN